MVSAMPLIFRARVAEDMHGSGRQRCRALWLRGWQTVLLARGLDGKWGFPSWTESGKMQSCALFTISRQSNTTSRCFRKWAAKPQRPIVKRGADETQRGGKTMRKRLGIKVYASDFLLLLQGCASMRVAKGQDLKPKATTARSKRHWPMTAMRCKKRRLPRGFTMVNTIPVVRPCSRRCKTARPQRRGRQKKRLFGQPPIAVPDPHPLPRRAVRQSFTLS